MRRGPSHAAFKSPSSQGRCPAPTSALALRCAQRGRISKEASAVRRSRAESPQPEPEAAAAFVAVRHRQAVGATTSRPCPAPRATTRSRRLRRQQRCHRASRHGCSAKPRRRHCTPGCRSVPPERAAGACRQSVPPERAAGACRRSVPTERADGACRRSVPPERADGACRRSVPPLCVRSRPERRGLAPALTEQSRREYSRRLCWNVRSCARSTLVCVRLWDVGCGM